MQGRLPEGWQAALRRFKQHAAAERPEQPGIRSSGMIVDLLTDAIPELLGGAPDLEAATRHKNRLQPFTSTDRGGRYIHYGVREYAMGATMNGMAVHGGVIPYRGTFLVFSDYERPALRMGAMMGVRVVLVLSHDSIGVGEDGPTHQPVEQLASLRAIPNMLVFRPADAVEPAECWKMALEERRRPVVASVFTAAVPLFATTARQSTCRPAAPMC